MTKNFAVVHSNLIRLRRTTPEDLDFVLRAEQHEEHRPFIIAWPRAQHQEALANADLAHLICENVKEYFPLQKVNLKEKFNLFNEYW